MFKYLILFLVLVLFTSCDEEEKILVEEDPVEEVEEEEEIKFATDTILPFKINNIYPPYAFWQSGIRITLDKNEFFDPSKLEIYFNDTLLPKIEVNNTGLQYIILTRMINDSYSDKFRFKYNSKDTILNLESDHYEIVNSEVRIDSIPHYFCNEYQTVYGNGFKYINHIRIKFRDKVYNSGASVDKPIGEKITNNEAIYKFKDDYYVDFFLVNSDTILSPKHPYPVSRTYKVDFTDYYHVDINRPKVASVEKLENKIIVRSRYWYKFNKNDIIKFGNIILNEEDFTFYRYQRYYDHYERKHEEHLSTLEFEIPENAENNLLEIDFNCLDENYTKLVEFQNQYKRAKLKFNNVEFKYDITGQLPAGITENKVLDFELDSLEVKIQFPYLYKNPDGFNNKPGPSWNNFSLREIKNEDNSYSYNLTFGYGQRVEGNNQSTYSERVYLYNISNYTSFETSDKYVIRIEKNQLKDIEFNATVDYSSLNAENYNGIFSELIIHDDSYLEIEFEKW